MIGQLGVSMEPAGVQGITVHIHVNFFDFDRGEGLPARSERSPPARE
jgi:hypothetical protein